MRGSSSAFLSGVILIFIGTIGSGVVSFLATTGRMGAAPFDALGMATILLIAAGAITVLGSMMILVGIYRGLRSIDDLHRDRFGRS